MTATMAPRVGGSVRIPDQFVMGVDLGETHDRTAFVILQRAGQWGELIHLRHVERIGQHVSYPDQNRYLTEVLGRDPLTGRCHVGVDATGVGRPVVEYMKREVPCPITPVVITSGTLASTDKGWRRVPKRDLIADAQVALEHRILRMNRRLPNADLLAAELMAYRVKISTNGHDSYANSARENEHDDIVLALCVAIHVAQRRGWGKPIVPRSNESAVNAEHTALHADPTAMIDMWADTMPTERRTVGRDPLAGWWEK